LKDGEIFTSFVGVRQAAVLVAAVEAALA
jgi:hypothetical protein